MDIQVEVRTVYGVPKIYPANQAAEVLATIAGTKTLTQFDLENAVKLGLTVVEVTPAKLGNLLAVA